MTIILAVMAPVVTTRMRDGGSGGGSVLSPWLWTNEDQRRDAYLASPDINNTRAAIGFGKNNIPNEGSERSRLILNATSQVPNNLSFYRDGVFIGRMAIDNNRNLLFGDFPSANQLGTNNVLIKLRSSAEDPGTTGFNVVIGNNALANLNGANHIRHNTAIGDNSLNTLQRGVYNTAIGRFANGRSYDGDPLIATGTGEQCILGNGHVCTGANPGAGLSGTIAIGSFSKALMPGAIAIGDHGMTFSHGAKATERFSIAIGGDAEASGMSAIAIGQFYNISSDDDEDYSEDDDEEVERHLSQASHPTRALGYGSVAIGQRAEARDDYAVALGNRARAQSRNSVALGRYATANERATALGSWTKALHASSVAVGYYAKATENNSVALGNLSRSLAQNTTAVGVSATADQQWATALGFTSEAKGFQSSALGAMSEALKTRSIAIGMQARSYVESGIAIGPGAEAGEATSSSSVLNSIAIGNGAKAKALNSIAIGNGVSISAPNIILLGSSSHTVQIPGSLTINKKLNIPSDTQAYIKKLKVDSLENASDARLKHIGSEYKSGLEKIKQLKPFNYTFKNDTEKTPRVGVIAQDLQKVFPDAVKKGSDGFFTVRMEDMFYAVVNAVKELDAKISEILKQVQSNTARIDEILRSAQNDRAILKQLQKDNERLQKENNELKARLDRIEAKLK